MEKETIYIKRGRKYIRLISLSVLAATKKEKAKLRRRRFDLKAKGKTDGAIIIHNTYFPEDIIT